MAAVSSHANGVNGVNGAATSFPPPRFSAVPSMLLVPIPDPDSGAIMDIESSLEDDIADDPTEICTLLENEKQDKKTWMDVATAYAKHNKVDLAIEVLSQANHAFARGRSEDRLSILNGLCWLYLLKMRSAPRVKPDTTEDVKTKDHYVQQVTSIINEASRINPSYAPLFLTRGVLLLLRASLLAPSTSVGPNHANTERLDLLKQAAKSFDDALRYSSQRNLMARLGKARALYSMRQYVDACRIYQSVMEDSPGLIDPDPRIGIGCCYWQLGHKKEAAKAWHRSRQLNPKSKIALILLAIAKFQETAHLSPSDPRYAELTRQAMTEYAIPAMQADKMFPLTNATLGRYFYGVKQMEKLETTSRRAIELTDVNDIASDGWYQLARKEHYDIDQASEGLSEQQINERRAKAMDFYTRSDRARGGDDRGFVPAKFGVAQMQILTQNYGPAKLKLEKILTQQPTLEAQILLGTLYAEEVFAGQANPPPPKGEGNKRREELADALKKALKYLEDVTKAWKDPKRNITPDQSVLLNLARLHEVDDHPEKSLKCLEEVEQIELKAIDDEDKPEGVEDARELLPPQLLNNMGCFHYQAERFAKARELFQLALNACVSAAAREEGIDTDALVTSISFNLGRTYEREGAWDEAKKVYEQLLVRHSGYVDAKIRLAHISLHQSPTDEGPKAVTKLFRENQDNLEVRALYGWYLSKSKRKENDLAKDVEQKHHKVTLQNMNHYDTYALTAMGNLNSAFAREVRPTNEQNKSKRANLYSKAAGFYGTILDVDPKNAYAAQGLAIMMAEEKKDHASALQIFNKVKETVKDASVYMNLGHIYCEIGQFPRAIENYEIALSKSRSNDPILLACLGRTWLMQGKSKRSLDAYKKSLEYSQRAYAIAPTQVHFRFNVAFVQMQLAQLLIGLKENERSLADLETAAADLDKAIDALAAIAKEPNPPFPAGEIDARANMGRNTMRGQMQRAREAQQKYEQANMSKLEQARAIREAEMKKREEEQRKKEEEAAERKRRIAEENRKLAERDREYMAKRLERERQRAEFIEEEGARKERRRAGGAGGRGGKRKKKAAEDEDSDLSDLGLGSGSEDEGRRERRSRRRTSASGTPGLTDADDEERPREKKKRKLTQKKKEPVGKYKSSEMIDDSDEEAGMDTAEVGMAEADTAKETTEKSADEEEEAAPVATGSRRKTARVIDEDEDEEEGAGGAATKDVVMDDDDE